MALRRRNASYVINPKSQVPADMAIGKMVSILPLGSSREASRADRHVHGRTAVGTIRAA